MLFTKRCVFYQVIVALMLGCVVDTAFGAAASNPRSVGTSDAATVVPARNSEGREAKRNNTASSAAVSRGVTAARPAVNASRAAATISGTVSARNGSARTAVAPRSTARVTTSGAARSAVSALGGHSARSATKTVSVSRAGIARATAVFSDISKIGGGYADCRESYATCMDQFCANANDTYRRCFCSSRFQDFRDAENAMDQAKLLLMQFQDKNLDAVDKTAAEVNAMYTATEGEKAIKKDTSGAAKMLNQINDLLSGKTSASSYSKPSLSLGVLSLDFSDSMDDIWSGDGSSIFGGGGANMASLEGDELYNAANKQCLSVMRDSCETTAVLNMARSSYGILISQDCNAYEKSVNSKRESVQQTVRTAEKYLREARLEEYRSHNSADVNECVTKVRNAITADVACGANYKRCLDYTGAYVNQSTGEAIYSPRLFELGNLILLDGANGSSDVLSQNPKFNQFLETRKMFATSALDTCRDKANLVWNEFKRTALIEIAQAQDEKIEEVKMSCVSTMAECYDTQSNALKSFDDTTAKATGALSAYAARKMCEEKVVACAALYGSPSDNQSCVFDGNGKLTSNSGGCGLGALLNFVNAVDTIRINEGCAAALNSYVQDLCTPTSGERGYPWNCRSITKSDLEGLLKTQAKTVCYVGSGGDRIDADLESGVQKEIAKILSSYEGEMMELLSDECEDRDGYWLARSNVQPTLPAGYSILDAFYNTVYMGKDIPADNQTAGWCVQNNTRVQCLAFNSDGENIATYNLANDECSFTEEWYRTNCSLLGGYYENAVCYLAKE